jgi:hypothetical protein
VEKGRQHGLFAPGFVVKIAIRMIRSSVLKAADFDIKLLSPIEHADKYVRAKMHSFIRLLEVEL